eukprot:m.209168 g.209168  ORF g.209168 m.209168 type:complete len:193 (-) comp18970_c0_seq6:2901-3479(-)
MSCQWCHSDCQMTFPVQDLHVCNSCYARYIRSRSHKYLGHHNTIRCDGCKKTPKSRKVWIDGWRKIRAEKGEMHCESDIRWVCCSECRRNSHQENSNSNSVPSYVDEQADTFMAAGGPTLATSSSPSTPSSAIQSDIATPSNSLSVETPNPLGATPWTSLHSTLTQPMVHLGESSCLAMIVYLTYIVCVAAC